MSVRKVHQEVCRVVINCKYPKLIIITQKFRFFMKVLNLIICLFKDRTYRFGKFLSRTEFESNDKSCPARILVKVSVHQWKFFFFSTYF